MIFLFIHSAPAMSPAKIRYGVASGPLHMLFSLSGLLVSGYLHSSLLYFSEDLLESHLLREATLSIIAIPHHTCLSPFLLYFTSWYSLQCSRLYILSTFCNCLFLYQNRDSKRTEIYLYSPLYPQTLEQCLVHAKDVINNFELINL